MTNPEYQILLVGEKGVGKTCIAHRADFDDFEKQKATKTPIKTSIKVNLGGGTNPSLELWDIPGKDIKIMSDKITFEISILVNAQGCFAVYDVTNRKSLMLLWNWIEKALQRYGDMPIILIGNKNDIIKKRPRQVSKEEGESLAKKLGVEFFEVSAKNDDYEVFEQIMKSMAKLLLLKKLKKSLQTTNY